MISEKVKQYIENHNNYPEMLFEDWQEFLELLYANHGVVSEILFYEYCKISEQQDSLGGDGYKDVNNSEYMYAETMIYERNLQDCSYEEILKYIDTIKKQHPNHDLFPSFFVE